MSPYESDAGHLAALTADIVTAYVGGNKVPAADLPEIIRSVHLTLQTLGTEPTLAAHLKPAVAIKRSVTNAHIICLEDGKKLKMLKRYLRTRYGLSPDDYRKKWGLPPDYPMVAPDYAGVRSEFAKKIGLGTHAVRRTSRGRRG